VSAARASRSALGCRGPTTITAMTTGTRRTATESSVSGLRTDCARIASGCAENGRHASEANRRAMRPAVPFWARRAEGGHRGACGLRRGRQRAILRCQSLQGHAVDAKLRVTLPPDPNPRKPRFDPPPGTCDTHFHVFGPPPLFPYVEKRRYTPPA